VWFLFAFPLWPEMVSIFSCGFFFCLFVCFATWISSLEKVLFSSVAHFLTGSLIFGEFSFLSSLVDIVGISPLSDVYS
jgi:hypothetical protein